MSREVGMDPGGGSPGGRVCGLRHRGASGVWVRGERLHPDLRICDARPSDFESTRVADRQPVTCDLSGFHGYERAALQFGYEAGDDAQNQFDGLLSA
jgi:hypothetical protein